MCSFNFMFYRNLWSQLSHLIIISSWLLRTWTFTLFDHSIFVITKLTIMIFRTFSPKYAIKANIWGAKYHEAEEGKRLWRVLVPKNIQKVTLCILSYRNTFLLLQDHHKFEAYIDKQSGEDSCFRIRKSSMWTGFLQHQEDLLHERDRKSKFIMAENTGLLDTVVKIGDRTTERYVFNENTMLNSQGKKLHPVDVIFHPTLSLKMTATPVLKAMRYIKYILFKNLHNFTVSVIILQSSLFYLHSSLFCLQSSLFFVLSSVIIVLF